MNHQALVTFRWLSLATATVASLVSGLTWELLAGLVVFAVSNAAWSRHSAWSPRGMLAGDTVALTAWLAATGGAMNPFSVYYLVYVVVAALLLDRGATVVVAVLSTIGFAILFVVSSPHEHHGDMRTHLLGMLVAYAVAAAVVTLFVARENEAARARERALAELKVSHAKMEKLAQLTTLAAGAAHELGSPLGTIAVIAGDLAANSDPELTADAQLIASEVERCRAILLRLRAEPGGEAERELSAAQLWSGVVQALGADAERADVSCDDAILHVPPVSFTQAVTNLVKNALEAAPLQRVAVRIDGALQRVTIDDTGAGLSAEARARLGEPFFTTKPPGRGLGLGIFLAKTLAEQHGGRLTFENRPGGGARFVLTVPRVHHAA